MTELFAPAGIGGMTVKNRFFRAATNEGMATEDGRLTPELLALYEALAAGGVGTILTGYTYISQDEQPSPRMLGAYDDRMIEGGQALAEAVHRHGAKLVMQLVYGGAEGKFNVGRTVWGPSAAPNPRTGIVPAEMTRDEIGTLIRLFADAARRAKQAGMDGVQLHAAHSYLLSTFLSPEFNRRTDEYGGSVENRARIVLAVYRAVREAVGADYPVLVKLNSEDWPHGGLTQEDSLTVASLLAEAGIDAIEVSGGTPRRPAADKGPYFAGYAAALAARVSVPVILTGGLRELADMQACADRDGIGFFGLCRPLLREPALIARWAAGDPSPSRCVTCNRCFAEPGKPCALR